MVVIYVYLERDNDKFSKFHMNNSSSFLNKHLPLVSAALSGIDN